MKKSLLALAVLGAFAGVASAQSSVTLYGRVDLSVGKGAGVEQVSLANGSGSRFGVRGVEDLGGGLQALFNIEHRYNADTGAQTNAARFWQGRSIVGLQGGFGQVVLGREYTPSFLQSQLVADPWGWDTVVTGTLGGSGGNASITGGGVGIAVPGGVADPRVASGVANVRNDSSITYKISLGGFTFGAQVAEATDFPGAGTVNLPNNPYSLALSYAAGPITAGLAYERNGNEILAEAEWLTVNAAWNFGAFKIGGFYGTGTSPFNTDRDSWLVSATAPLGAGELRASYGELEDSFLGKVNKVLALGYHYSLSKRTTIYADFIYDDGRVVSLLEQLGVGDGSKEGYDFGVKHNF
jgi:predicted porin